MPPLRGVVLHHSVGVDKLVAVGPLDFLRVVVNSLKELVAVGLHIESALDGNCFALRLYLDGSRQFNFLRLHRLQSFRRTHSLGLHSPRWRRTGREWPIPSGQRAY